MHFEKPDFIVYVSKNPIEDCTVRDRDTQKQVRVKMPELKAFLLKQSNI